MQKLQWERLEGKGWKPESNVQYLLELTNPRIEEKLFTEQATPKSMLCFDVLSVTREDKTGVPEEPRYFAPPKHFMTANQSFINSIKPILESATNQGKESIVILLRKTGTGNDTTYHVNDATIVQKFRR